MTNTATAATIPSTDAALAAILTSYFTADVAASTAREVGLVIDGAVIAGDVELIGLEAVVGYVLPRYLSPALADELAAAVVAVWA